MSYTTLVPAEILAAHLEDPTWVVLDCRARLGDPGAGRALYRQAHVPGALPADLERELSGPPGGDAGRHPLPEVEPLKERLGDWGIGPGVQVVCYDDAGGQFAARAWWLLHWLGHEAAAVLDGGWQRWLALGLPTAQSEEPSRPTTFRGEPRPELLADYAAVRAISEGGGGLLVDARAPERFRGEHEPIDPVAGHIPGARNRPSSQNLDDSQRFHPPERLADEWRALLGEQPAEAVVAYCGSGVTACHNILALRHAGLGQARLFVPSWSGWSADAARPVARGSGEAPRR